MGQSRRSGTHHPGAEVAEVIAGVIRSRQRDVYTRPGVRQAVLDYLGALGQDVVSTTPAPAPE